jgi:two-component system phosphate regulon response regulator OmpR
MQQLLMIEDDARLAQMVGEYLERSGFGVTHALDAQAGLALLQEPRSGALPDLVILDLMLPDLDGLEVCRRVRALPGEGGKVPILMLTAKGDPMDRIVGLELGADDYLPKPFETRELLARVRALLRRLGDAPEAAPAAPTAPAAIVPAAPPGKRIAFGGCVLDVDERRLFGHDGAEIPITAAEFDLLALFARHPNRPLNRDQIMEQAHNRGWDVFDRSIDLRVMRLRRKIERNPDKPEVIKTVRNVGYVFVPAAGG